MSKNRRVICLILALIMTAFVFTSCSGATKPESPTEKKKIVLYSFDTFIKETEASGYFKAFEEANNCIVTYIVQPSATYVQAFMVASNAGQQIDVLCLNGQNARSFANKGIIVDLTNQIKYWDRFYENSLEVVTFGGKKYAVPMGSSGTSGLLYNKALLSKYNLEPPKNINDVLEIAKKLKGQGISAITNGGSTIYMWPLWYFTTLNQTSGNKAIERTTAVLENKAKWTDRDFVEAMKALEILGTGDNVFQNGFNGQDQDAGKANFIAEKSAMWYGLSSGYDAFVKAGMDSKQLGMIQFPLVKEGYTAQPTGAPIGGALALYSKVSDANKDLSLKLIDFMSTDEFAVKVTGAKPPIYANKNAKVEISDNILKIMRDELSPKTVVYLDWLYPPEITTALQQNIQAVTGGKITSEKVMEDMQKVMDELLAKGYDFNATK